jgi:GNAT superfamily N-acetyltransferase
LKVIDLPQEQEKAYFQCLEEWSEELRDAGDRKEKWYDRMRGRGLRVKVAVDDQGTVGGMIHYAPIEQVAVEGSQLYYLYCIWVHGYARGRGNFQKRGMGKALLEAAERDVRQLGGKGFAVWGLSLPLFIDSRQMRTGPPPSYEKIRQAIAGRLKKRKR